VPALAAASAPLAPVLALFVAITWASLVTHELAHGLACKHYGGHVAEIGLAVRYLAVLPYCTLDDLVMMPRRRRLIAVLAGPIASALWLVPSCLVYAVTAPGSLLHAVAVLMLTVFNAMTWLNLVPFVRMDGYLALSMMLDMPELRADAYAELRGLGGKRRAGVTRRERRLLLAYAVPSLAATVAIVGWMLGRWYTFCQRHVGTRGAFIAMAAALLMVAVTRRALAATRARTTRRQEDR
jgi:putative peptide zinc metalloprotease protein